METKEEIKRKNTALFDVTLKDGRKVVVRKNRMTLERVKLWVYIWCIGDIHDMLNDFKIIIEKTETDKNVDICKEE